LGDHALSMASWRHAQLTSLTAHSFSDVSRAHYKFHS
jgi:hypothetical protein